jgi:hypothetical protein
MIHGIPIKVMKTIHNLTSALVAAGSAGVALLTISDLVPADLGFAVLTILGIAAFALFDYARPARSLAVAAPALRPELPVVRSTRRIPAIVEKAA